jgi:hypothetical protein
MFSPVKRLLIDVFEQCDEIAEETIPGDTKKITALLQKLSLIYYLDVRWQAKLSFWSAFGAAVIGMGFFAYAIVHSMTPSGNEARVGLWAGGLSQFISAINFFLYFKVARQFATFHVCLERTNRFLLANTMCDSLQSPRKDEVRAALADIIACAPMLTLDDDGVPNKQSKPKATHASVDDAATSDDPPSPASG